MENGNEGNVEREYLRREVITSKEAYEVGSSLHSFPGTIVKLEELLNNPNEFYDLNVRTLGESVENQCSILEDIRFNHRVGILVNQTKKGIGYSPFTYDRYNKSPKLYEFGNEGTIKDFKEQEMGRVSKNEKDLIKYSFSLDDFKEIYGTDLFKKTENEILFLVSFGSLTQKPRPFLLGYEVRKSGKPVLNFAEPSSRDCLVLQYFEHFSLEKALIEDYMKPESLGNGVKVYSESNVPKYLQRKLGL